MNKVTSIQFIETDEHIHIQVENEQGQCDRVVLSNKEWEFAQGCMDGTAPFYPYFDDVNFLVQIMNNGIRVKYVPGHLQTAEVRVYLFPMELVKQEYPAKRIWDTSECKRIANSWDGWHW